MGWEMRETARKGFQEEGYLRTNHVGFSLSNYICTAVEYHDILFLNNPSSSLLITNRYHSSRMNNLKKKSLNKSRLIAFLKKSNFLMFLLRAEQRYSQRSIIFFFSFLKKKYCRVQHLLFLKGCRHIPISLHKNNLKRMQSYTIYNSLHTSCF